MRQQDSDLWRPSDGYAASEQERMATRMVARHRQEEQDEGDDEVSAGYLVGD
jgi:hypothetical protein